MNLMHDAAEKFRSPQNVMRIGYDAFSRFVPHALKPTGQKVEFLAIG